MPGHTPSRRPRGGVQKSLQRRDRDGDLIMGAAPRVAAVRRSPRPSANGGPVSKAAAGPTRSFTELKVTGWTDDKEMSKLINFLERHSARRSPNVAKSNVPPKMIKRHRVTENTLTIWVRPEDVSAFSKINGFTFTSVQGTQKLTITGPGIRSKSPSESNAMDTTDAKVDGKDTSATIQLLKDFLARRYDPDTKLLNLSTIANDEEIAKSGMWDSAVTQAKFFPALMVVCNDMLKSAQEKRELVHSVTLSGNNLPNIEIIRQLATTLPHIQNLDLSGNQFKSIRDVKGWKHRFRFLEHLIIEITEAGWEEELISWFPKLRILNTQQVRPDPPAPAPAEVQNVPTVSSGTPPGLTTEQEAMVVYVQSETKLKRELAVQCLEAAGWNIEAAAQLFLAQKDSLPAESFN